MAIHSFIHSFILQAHLRESERLTAMHEGLARFGVTRFADHTEDEFRQFAGMNSK